jgi:hypothetical protein
MNRDEVIAYHEAGHVLALVIQGCGDILDNVTLDPPQVNRSGALPPLVEATTWLAGSCAQARYLDVTLLDVLNEETDPNHFAMAERTLCLYDDRPDEAAEVIERYGRLPDIGDIIRRSEQLVTLHWRDIERVALALLEHGRRGCRGAAAH